MNSLRSPIWQNWLPCPTATLWECVALSLEVDPDAVSYHKYSQHSTGFWRKGAEFRTQSEPEKRLRILTRVVNARVNPIEVTERPGNDAYISVNLPSFVRWAVESANWQLPKELNSIIAMQTSSINTRWPWGNHTTDHLDALAEAAHEWWSSFDPEDPETAPTNTEVVDWLVNKRKRRPQEPQMSEKVADVIATMLRPTNLPAGRRKSKLK